MKKFTLFLLSVLPLSSTAFSAPVFKLSGSLEAQYGVVKRGSQFKENKEGQLLRSRGLVNNGKMKLEMDYVTESDLKYGGMMEFNANTSKSKSGNQNILNKSMMYAESNIGRFEAGTHDGAAGKFRESVFSPLDVATGGAWGGDSLFWINKHTITGKENESVFVLSPDLVVPHDASGSANKVSYYSPKYNGIQIGLTYVPDAAVKGTVTEVMKKPGNVFSPAPSNTLNYDEKPGYKDVFDASIKYELDVKDVKMASFVTGEMGKSKKYNNNGTLNARRPLRAWDAGSVVSYRGFSLGGSYGNWRHSGVFKSIDKSMKQHSSFYTLGAGYSCGDLSTAITYFSSRAAAGIAGGTKQYSYDKAKLLSVAVEYKLMPGFKPYAEVTSFNLGEHNQRPNKGVVALFGTKLSF